MKIAIMQPYLFPYFGYFQLINSVDKFIIYDDVNFIKQGWINRNNILVNDLPYLFTVPLSNQSSFDKINNIKIDQSLYDRWLKKFLKTIEQTYSKAVFFEQVYPIISNVFTLEQDNISSMGTKSLKLVCDYIGLSTKIEENSTIYKNEHLTAQSRVIDICLIEKANHYINPIGGIELYCKDAFLEHEIILSFIKTKSVKYKQFNNSNFWPNLSIIDMLMFNDKLTVKNLLNEYELI
ncbi:WbqC family protein [Flavobacterium johnsoniae]|uniref:WbqC-like protein family protein n=1 Tax=Flavobacterium johnsoniae TaxID=986 RepID=A0A1M5L2P6_FLAJO|nr:WbqC family protein [Flavobacterium johnsoniae]SHG59261.1 WbqC-like protein family protein [Flavobacterium johnsoniae]